MICTQRAKERGATIIKEIWSETDEFGTVRFATVQTVRDFILNKLYTISTTYNKILLVW